MYVSQTIQRAIKRAKYHNGNVWRQKSSSRLPGNSEVIVRAGNDPICGSWFLPGFEALLSARRIRDEIDADCPINGFQ